MNPNFVVTLVCLSDLLSLILVLSRSLQKKNTDLKRGAAEVFSLITILSQRRRQEAEKEFSQLWKKANKTADVLDVSLTMPQRAGRKLHRANYQTDSPEVYYRLAIYIPMLDHFLTDLKNRFPQCVLDVFHLPALVPDCLLKHLPNELETSAELLFSRFSNILEVMGAEKSTGLAVLKAKITMWKEKWASVHRTYPKAVPTTVIEALRQCSVDVYSIVHRLLKVLAMLPVSNAKQERSHATLRRLKTWLRTTMDQKRLTGLALMNVHRDIDMDVDKVTDRFAKSGKRRMPFHLRCM